MNQKKLTSHTPGRYAHRPPAFWRGWPLRWRVVMQEPLTIVLLVWAIIFGAAGLSFILLE